MFIELYFGVFLLYWSKHAAFIRKIRTTKSCGSIGTVNLFVLTKTHMGLHPTLKAVFAAR